MPLMESCIICSVNMNMHTAMCILEVYSQRVSTAELADIGPQVSAQLQD